MFCVCRSYTRWFYDKHNAFYLPNTNSRQVNVVEHLVNQEPENSNKSMNFYILSVNK